MSYNPSGNLVTDKRVIEESSGWDTQTEWEAYQSKNQISIIDGILQLSEEVTGPIILDDFEDGDIAEYDGDIGVFGMGAGYNSTYSAKATLDANTDDAIIITDTITISTNDEPFGVYMYIDVPTYRDKFLGTQPMQTQLSFIFGAQAVSGLSSLSGYAIQLNPAFSDIRAATYDNGTRTDQSSISSSNSFNGVWIKLTVTEWLSDSFAFEVYDVTNDRMISTHTYSNPKYTTGYVGLGAVIPDTRTVSETGYPRWDDIFGPVQ